MKLAMDSYTLSDRYGDEKMIELLADAGFDAVDFSIYRMERANHTFFADDYLSHIEKLNKLMKAKNIECCQAHAEFNVKKGDEMTLDNENFFRMIRGIECAALLGAKQVVVHPIGSERDFDFMEYNYQFYKCIEPYCQKYGIKVAIENLFEADGKRGVFERKLGTPVMVNSLIDRLDSEWFVACVDLGHSYITGTAPEDFIRGYDGSRLAALHVQDTNYGKDCHSLPYLENLNWDNITQALADIGYEGDFSMEVLYYVDKFPDELVPDALKLAERVGRHLIAKIEKAKQK